MMNNNKLISIIVPIYNVQDYLIRCVDSLLQQSYPNIEILLVDDGSSDKSGEIADSFKIKDPRIVVIHKKNGGLSDARNAGLSVASGDYIGFVDSDDYVDKRMYEELLKAFNTHNNVDFVSGIDVNVYENGKVVGDTFNGVEIINREEIIKRFLFRNRGPSQGVCNKLFKSSLIKNYFFPKGYINEDSIWLANLYKKCDNVIWTSAAKYYYCHRSGSITKSSFVNHMNDYVIMNQLITESLMETNYAFIECGCKVNLLYAYRETLLNLLNHERNKSLYKELTKKYRQTYRTAKDKKMYLPLFLRRNLFLFYLSPHLYNTLKRIRHR